MPEYMTKKAARDLAKDVRATLHQQTTFDDLDALARHLKTAFGNISKQAVVAGYMPIQSEIDCRPALHALERAGYDLCLPKVMAKDQPLSFFRWSVDAPLVMGDYGVGVPTPDAPQVVPDIILVPLLAFDAEGYRLGYGGGFYDRTLDGLRRQKGIYAVGLAYEQQLVNAVPRDEYDQRLDMIITPKGQWLPKTHSH